MPFINPSLDLSLQNQQAMPNAIKSSKSPFLNRMKDKGTPYAANVFENGFMQQPTSRFEEEEYAAKAQYMAYLDYFRSYTQLNLLQINDYANAMEKMSQRTDQDALASNRRSIENFSRGKSAYSGVARHPDFRTYQAGNRPAEDHCSLGIFDNQHKQEEASAAFDAASTEQKEKKQMSYLDSNKNQMQTGTKTQEERLDPLSLNLGVGVGSCKNLVKRPTALQHSLEEPKNQESKEALKLYRMWALQKTRKELANASASRFKHGAFSPFRYYPGKQRASALIRSGQASFSPLENYKRRKSTFLQPCDQTSHGTQWWSRAQGGLKFKHASGSAFKPYENDDVQKKGNANLFGIFYR